MKHKVNKLLKNKFCIYLFKTKVTEKVRKIVIKSKYFQLLSETTKSTKELKDKKKILKMEELQSRKRVLRIMGFSTESDVLTEKGYNFK